MLNIVHMELMYIYHSGFALLGDGFTMLIDFYKEIGKESIIDSLLGRPGRFYVLSTHSHPDHFNHDVLSWKERRPDIEYIFSKEILRHRKAKPEDARFLRKFEIHSDGLITVEAFGSTDIGASFLIEAEDKLIFHAGDLNNWHWNEESTPQEIKQAESGFLAELKFLEKRTKALDVAMFPVDPRLGKDYMLGASQFLDHELCRWFLPMHFDCSYDAAEAFRSIAESHGCHFAVLQPGEKIII